MNLFIYDKNRGIMYVFFTINQSLHSNFKVWNNGKKIVFLNHPHKVKLHQIKSCRLQITQRERKRGRERIDKLIKETGTFVDKQITKRKQLLPSEIDRKIDRNTTDRQTYRHKDRLIGRPMDRQSDRQKDSYIIYRKTEQRQLDRLD